MPQIAPLAALGAALILALPVSAAAGPVAGPRLDRGGLSLPVQHPALTFVARNKRPRTEGVTAIVYPKGEFRKVGPRKWVEIGKRAQFQFREVGDDGRMITLFDRSRNIFVYFNLRREKILWAPDGEEPRDLYPIIGVIKDAPREADDFEQEPDVPQLARFTCEEGIPMVVRIENRGERSRAFVSIDGGPDMRLNQVPTGSGAKYSDGLYTVLIKGRNAVLEYDNNTDVCIGSR